MIIALSIIAFFAAFSCVALVVYNLNLKKALKRAEVEEDGLKIEITKQSQTIMELNNEISFTKNEYHHIKELWMDMSAEVKDFQEKYLAVDKELTELKANKNFNKSQIELETSLSHLENERERIANELVSINEQKTAAQNELDSIRETYEGFQTNCTFLTEQINELIDNKKLLTSEIDKLAAELASRQASFKAALLAEDGDQKGWVFELSKTDERLISLVEEIRNLYPDLSVDLGGILWKRIWLPKIQQLSSKEGLDKKCGIYRLRLKDDEKICYVGQAVNIKERWYDHIKKMLGAVVRGNERLYDYSPEDFVWEVVEEVDRSELNEKERFWIDWYGCVEIGLNKKKG